MNINNLINERKNKNLKSKEMAEILGIKFGTYSHYETQDIKFPIIKMNLVCNYLDISFDYAFNFTNIKRYPKERENINIKLSSQRLKSFRISQGLKQKELCKMLGIDNSTFSKYERGEKIIPTLYLYALCLNYGISADYLLGKIDTYKCFTIGN